MKTVPPTCPEPETGAKYWRSLDQVAGTPEFQQWLEREFPAGAAEFTDPVSRRHFVKIMSASFLLMGLGLTGCRRPKEEILPFSKMPENYLHGVPQYYATARPARGLAVPLVVKSNDGRPTKIEGNAHHPSGVGGTDAFTQASILNLYDPDRALRFSKAGEPVSREAGLDALTGIAGRLASNEGAGLAVLGERNGSPTYARVKEAMRRKYPQARWFTYEPVDFDVYRQGATLAFGESVRPDYRFEKAARVLSLDCDFLGAEEDVARWIRGFAQGRKIEEPEDELNRLYVVEALFTVTGANADHRLRVPASQLPVVAARLGLEILRAAGAGGVAAAAERLAGGFDALGIEEGWVVECAKDLFEHRGRCLIVAGHRQPPAVHALAHLLNSLLGNVGETVVYLRAAEDRDESLAELAGALNEGSVNTLAVIGGNPVHDAPADLDWREAQRKAGLVIRFGYYEDETSAASDWHVPAAHFLESWGDARTGDGTYVPVQPLIEPLFGGLTAIEFLARLGGLEVTDPHALVRETFRGMVSGNGEEAWKQFLHDGFLGDSAVEPVNARPETAAIARALESLAVPAVPTLERPEVVFFRDYSLDDGRYNNNGWLQETPDPITKLVWDNAVLMSPATAKALNLSVARVMRPHDVKNHNMGESPRNDVVEVEVNGRKVTGAVWIQPGMADHTFALALGYGREKTGRVGHQSGFNACRLRTTGAMQVAPGARLTPTGRTTWLASTQEHGALEGRPIVREANLEQFRQAPDFAKNMGLAAHAPNAGRIYKHPYTAQPELRSTVHQWGMSIDLNSCVGCNACVVACQSENNVPIVGKDQVIKGREMHWMRIDRYYAGEPEAPQVAYQPMLCQHCESAPCESVCPVNATVHDAEGLNVMAYNRCVGTRYCSNNCAWKVRRFNFFDYNKRPINHAVVPDTVFSPPYQGPLAKREPLDYDLMRMLKNPDVTVRMRGVMEKCTYCTQRIEQAKIARKVNAGASDDVEVPDGTIRTACQQVCPADAIVFGNILDPESRVSRLKERQRDYTVLGFLDTGPRTTYLARVRNPNPSMPDHVEHALTTRDYLDKGNSSPFEAHGAHDDGHGPAAGEGGH